ncbi:MAG TPA: hypothetical protein PLZ10_11255 [Chitinophagaceae bacterium]|nr:hypothetical protein [Chitinophagaceae bacterium]
MRTHPLIPILGCSLLLAACFSASRDEPAAMDDIFFEYSVNAEEGNDSVSVLLKFKEYDEYGQAISIEPGKVSLDGISIAADSTPMTGPFYTLNKHIREFTGKHRIEVVLPDHKKFRDEFSFQPFSVRSPLPDTLKRAKLQLEFNGLNSGEVVRLIITDTSFTGDGIHRLDSIWNNRMLITKNDLSFLEPGPINLELTRESVQKLRNVTGAGGIISISYTIRKECWLRD